MAGTFQCKICGHIRALNLKIFLTHVISLMEMMLAFKLHVGLVDVRGSFPSLTHFISIYEDITRKNMMTQIKAAILGKRMWKKIFQMKTL